MTASKDGKTLVDVVPGYSFEKGEYAIMFSGEMFFSNRKLVEDIFERPKSDQLRTVAYNLLRIANELDYESE